MRIVSLLGPPGSGKSSIGADLAALGYAYHLSIGNVLRKRRQSGDYDNQPGIIKCLDNGELLPTDFIICLIKQMLQVEIKNDHRVVILDGFMRHLDQALEFEEKIQKFEAVVCLTLPLDMARERYLDRKLPGREQDDRALLEKRVAEFDIENEQIKKHYHTAGKWFEITSDSTDLTYNATCVALAVKVWGYSPAVNSRRDVAMALEIIVMAGSAMLLRRHLSRKDGML